jgi:GrpB-like predicted nucleotidyltransferase (UPF0157 family)
MDEIELAGYDPQWPVEFRAEEARILAVLPPQLVLAVEHFGSTAIPGLAAKPIIDILIAVSSLAEAREQAIAPLERIGYAFWRDNPKLDRLFLVKGLPPKAERRTHHIHMTENTGELWQRLLFRDYLRLHPEEAQAYEQLKRTLAVTHREDREAYTTGKADYIDQVMQRARAGADGRNC